MDKNNETKGLFDRLTLGIIQTLEKKKGVCDVTKSENPPAVRSVLVGWEQKSSCILPDDLRNFYLTSDGLSLKWSLKHGAHTMPLGHMEINPVTKLQRRGGVGSSHGSEPANLGDVDESDDEELDGQTKPHFDSRSRIFELDACDGCGKTCLVYKDTKPGIPASKPEIWFLDCSLRWHFLAPCFTSYYRLMLMHLGLPQWQYAFTDIGLSPQVKQWFNMFAPIRLDLDDSADIMAELNRRENITSPLDIGKVFKGKSDKKKPQSLNIAKKKPAAASFKPITTVGRSTTSTSTYSNKSSR